MYSALEVRHCPHLLEFNNHHHNRPWLIWPRLLQSGQCDQICKHQSQKRRQRCDVRGEVCCERYTAARKASAVQKPRPSVADHSPPGQRSHGPTSQWEVAQRGDELNHLSPVFLQAKEDCITRSNAKVLQATHKPNRHATFDHSLKFTGSWLVQLFLERPNRRQDCIEGWGFAKDHRFSVFVITHQPPGHVIRW
jgi:hypothetical protein